MRIQVLVFIACTSYGVFNGYGGVLQLSFDSINIPGQRTLDP